MKQTLRITEWSGGTSADDTVGPKASVAYSRQHDFRSTPSLLQLQPQLAEDSNGVVTDLLMDGVLAPSGDIYWIGDTGNFYKRAISDGSWTLITDFGQASGGSLVYRSDTDSILIPLQNKVAEYKPVSGTPIAAQVYVNRYGASRSELTTALRAGGGNTYTLATSISEASTAQCSILSDIEPGYSVKVRVIAKGTGDLTLTLHDDANNNLGSSTVVNASLNPGSLNEFVFTVPIRLLVKPNARTYHFHLTSTVADATVAVGTSGDLSTADFEFWASRFVETHNGLHPAMQFLQYTLYGNERYVAQHEPLEDNATNAEWQRHRLTFPSGYEVCGMTPYQEFAAIACERQNSNGSIDFQNGIIFLWNGIDTTYSQAIPIPEGSPQSIYSYENELYWHAGGSWYTLVGGKPQRIRRLPGATEEFGGVYNQIGINPNMATVRRGVLLSGFPTSTANSGIEHGVYSLGSLDRTYVPSFGLDFNISTGSRFNSGNNLRIGCVKNLGDLFFVSWRDDFNSKPYGVDSLSPLSLAASDARVESLWISGNPEMDIVALSLKVVFKALPANCTVTPIWRTERDGAWTNEDGSIVQAVAGDTSVKLAIDQRCNEIQVGAITETQGNNVSIRAIALQIDPLPEEVDL